MRAGSGAPGNFSTLIAKTQMNDTRNRRTPNPKVYQSFKLVEDNPNNLEPYKRNLK
jgi:hypothetical protein